MDIEEFREHIVQGRTIKELQTIYGISRTKVADLKKQHGLVGLTPNSKKVNRLEGTKVCSKCLETKTLDNFYSNGKTPSGSSKYKPACIKCENSIRRNNVSMKIIDYIKSCGKTYACERCGYSGVFGSLDFHHVNPGDKQFSIGDYTNRTMSSYKFETDLVPELEKCILLCPNCHRQEHLLAGQKQFRQGN